MLILFCATCYYDTRYSPSLTEFTSRCKENPQEATRYLGNNSSYLTTPEIAIAINKLCVAKLESSDSEDAKRIGRIVSETARKRCQGADSGGFILNIVVSMCKAGEASTIVDLISTYIKTIKPETRNPNIDYLDLDSACKMLEALFLNGQVEAAAKITEECADLLDRYLVCPLSYLCIHKKAELAARLAKEHGSVLSPKNLADIISSLKYNGQTNAATELETIYASKLTSVANQLSTV